MSRSCVFASLMLVASSVVAQSATGYSTPPFPSDALIGFIENNPTTFDADYRKRLFNGYKRVLSDSNYRALRPFVFEGTWTNVPNTESPVRSSSPHCDTGTQVPKRDVDVENFVTGLNALTIISLGTGAPILAGVSTIAAVGTLMFTQKRQDYASCALTCAMVPGAIDMATITQFGRVTLEHRTPSSMQYSGATTVASPSAPPMELGWASWESPLFSVTAVPASKSPIALPPGHAALSQAAEGGKCPSTLVCGRFKNGSHTWPRSVRISVALDPGPWLENGCYDTSIIDGSVRSTYLQPALRRADLNTTDLLKKYFDALPKN